ncbi:MAG: 3-oxoacyl-[acyl-carrier protein] reductase [Gammaproteobacteria bacterium]|jgi:3-oxoacyl-[acyl-carrier protein] reductase
MHNEFIGRTVIVTGAVRGIGRAIAHAFAHRGALVIAADIVDDELADVVATLGEDACGRIETQLTDVTDAASVAALVVYAEAQSAHGSVDVLVHSAGGVRGRSKQPIESVSEQDWQAIQDVNVRGAFLCARAVVPGMKRAERGRIVIISSRAGLGVSLTGIASYGTAKAAQIGLVRQLAHELGSAGITVNSVAPGFMRTSPDSERQWQSYSANEQQAVLARVAMRRMGKPEDIANAVLFFAGDASSWVTGQTLAVTGSP